MSESDSEIYGIEYMNLSISGNEQNVDSKWSHVLSRGYQVNPQVGKNQRILNKTTYSMSFKTLLNI